MSYSSKYAPGKGSKVTCQARKQVRQQDYGLIVELRDDDGGVYVKEITKGIFQRQHLPIMVGDEIIQMNDRDVPDDFQGGLPEIEYYIETELAIHFTVVRNTDETPLRPPPISPNKKKKKGPPKIVRSGMLMKLQGILAKHELNGKVVEILGRNATGDRWEVMVMQAQTQLAVTEDKLDFLQVEKQYSVKAGDILLLQEIKAKPELNGETVRVLGEADTSSSPGRWKVQLVDVNNSGKTLNDDGVVLSVTPDKLVTEEEFWKNSWRRAGWDV
jgi:ribosomal protein S28E/S33